MGKNRDKDSGNDEGHITLLRQKDGKDVSSESTSPISASSLTSSLTKEEI